MRSSPCCLRQVATVFSAALLLLACVAWARSTRAEDTFSHWRALQPPPQQRATMAPGHVIGRTLTVELVAGAVTVQRGTYTYEGSQPRFTWQSRPRWHAIWGCVPATPDVRYQLAGFVVSKWDRFSSWQSTAVRVPLWFVTIAAALMPAWALVGAVVRRRSPREGCCATCGYDLRATPERCPECGSIPARSITKADAPAGCAGDGAAAF